MLQKILCVFTLILVNWLNKSNMSKQEQCKIEGFLKLQFKKKRHFDGISKMRKKLLAVDFLGLTKSYAQNSQFFVTLFLLKQNLSQKLLKQIFIRPLQLTISYVKKFEIFQCTRTIIFFPIFCLNSQFYIKFQPDQYSVYSTWPCTVVPYCRCVNASLWFPLIPNRFSR